MPHYNIEIRPYSWNPASKDTSLTTQVIREDPGEAVAYAAEALKGQPERANVVVTVRRTDEEAT